MRALHSVHDAFLALLVGHWVMCSTFGFKVEIDKLEVENLRQLQKIKRDILRVLGLPKRPNSGGNIPKKPIKRFFEQIEENDNREDVFDVTDIVQFAEAAENYTDKNIIQFRMTENTDGHKYDVQSANLLIRVKYRRKKGEKSRKKSSKVRRIRLKVSYVNADGKAGQVITSVRQKIKKTKWLKLGLPHSLFESFVQSEAQTLRLYITCKGCKRDTRIVLVHNDRSKQTNNIKRHRRHRVARKRRRLNFKRPFLILHTRVEKVIPRIKRDTKECPATGLSTGRCCKSSIYVNFADIGWGDWILAPSGFTTAQCYGQCTPGQESMQAHPNDSSVAMADYRLTPRTCQPVRGAPLRLIYFDGRGSIISSRLQNMITSRCQCK